MFRDTTFNDLSRTDALPEASTEFVMDEDDERFTFAFRRFSIRCDRLERVDRAECTGLR